MSKYLIGFDIGTQSSKCLLTDLEGNVIGKYQKKHTVEVEKAGYQEQDMSIWWMEFKEAIDYFLTSTNIDKEDIGAIGVTGLVPAFCAIDKEGNPIRKSILHTDTRAEVELLEINNKLESPISHGFLLPKIMWVKNNEKEVYEKIDKIMVPHSYIVYKLTKKKTFDYDTATIIGGIFDDKNLDWNEDILDNFGLDKDKFPNCYPASYVVGVVSKEAAKETGLSTNTKVIVGSGDTFSSMLGGGAYGKNQLMIYLGTSTTIVYADTSPKNYISCPHYGDDKANFVGRIISFGESITHLRDTLRYDNWDELDKGLESAPVGADGLWYLPHYKQQQKQSFFGLDSEFMLGYKTNHNQYHMYRAMIEGIAYNIKSNIDEFDLADINQINLFGGGANSKEICQIICDVLNKEICFCSKSSTAFGIAFLAGYVTNEIPNFKTLEDKWLKDSEIISPNIENSKIYEDLFEKYIKIKEKIDLLNDEMINDK